MNFNKNDYPSLLNQIAAATDRNFTEPQIISLVETMQTLGWEGAVRIVLSVIKTGNIPRNVYGYLLALLEEEIERLHQLELQKKSWAAAKDCASAEEFHLTMKCISTICKFSNSMELLANFGDYLNTACNKNNLLEALKKADTFYSELYIKYQLDSPRKDELHEGF